MIFTGHFCNINNMSTNQNSIDLKKSKKRCLNYRKRILDISQNVTAIHAAGALSSFEMLDCVYFALMQKDKKEKYSDTFLLSKGHSCIGQYVVLEEVGILKKNDLDLYCKPNGILGAHPDYGTPGIAASTGSLGHGMGLAVGMAHADKLLKKDKKVFILISDGELQEGSTWETMMMGANLNLKNIICLLDHNGSQASGHTKKTHPQFYPIKEKVEAFGWECEQANGHNVLDIYEKIINRKGEKPFLLIGDTVKGKGVSFMENEPIWHYRSPTKEQYEQAVSELQEVDS